jgi:hypothetical protein
LGLKDNDVIPFVNGRPVFAKYAKEIHNVKGLNGDHSHDMPLIHDQIARQKGWLKPNGSPDRDRVTDWLKDKEWIPHHAEGSRVEVLEARLHGCTAWGYNDVRHTGSASDTGSCAAIAMARIPS